jgi:hypothetical protein
VRGESLTTCDHAHDRAVVGEDLLHTVADGHLDTRLPARCSQDVDEVLSSPYVGTSVWDVGARRALGAPLHDERVELHADRVAQPLDGRA